jgi:hypothetical protein
MCSGYLEGPLGSALLQLFPENEKYVCQKPCDTTWLAKLAEFP